MRSDEVVQRAVARGIGLLPERVARRIAGAPPPTWRGAALDARIAALLAMSARRGQSFRPEVDLPTMRAGYARMNRVCGLGDGGVAQRDVAIPTDDGEIAARLYLPRKTDLPLPLLIWFHGGGYVIGDVPAYDHLASYFARTGRLAVLSVEYRLAPEHRYPRAHEDAFAALAWAQRNAALLGADPARIAVGGDSAGGGIAAAVAAFAAARGIAPPAYQLLVYPSVDPDGGHASRTAFASGLPLTSATIAWFASHHGPAQAGQARPLLAPMRADSLAGAPPAYVLAAGFDPLVDEGRAYAERLREAGVPVEYDLRPTLSHAFANLAGAVPAARRALRDAIRTTAAALRKA
jgi:acetyl esterase